MKVLAKFYLGRGTLLVSDFWFGSVVSQCVRGHKERLSRQKYFVINLENLAPPSYCAAIGSMAQLNWSQTCLY